MKSLLINNIIYINWNSYNLICVIIQEIISYNILMVAWFNHEALFKTLNFLKLIFFSRSRKNLWLKGCNSGNLQYLKFIYLDCDLDILLLCIFQLYRNSCHINNSTCFFNKLNL